MIVSNNRSNKLIWLAGLCSLHYMSLDNDGTHKEAPNLWLWLVKIAAVTWQQKLVIAEFKYLLQLTFSTAVQFPYLQPQLIRPSPSPFLLCCPILNIALCSNLLCLLGLIQSLRPQHSQPPNSGCYQASVLEQRSLGGGVGEMIL